MVRPFRFGVIDESSQTRAAWVAQARQVEAWGYATLLLRDHFIAGEFAHQLAPIAGLMAAADATTTLRVGSLVFANDYRHPAVLAKEAATIDVLSDGRFELGIGAGWLKDEYEQVGIPFAGAGERVERLREAVQVIKAIWQQGTVTYQGRYYTLTNFSGFPQPHQQPRLPILIGAGSKRMLQLAAHEADIIGILPKALPAGAISEEAAERLPETIAQKIAWIREAAGESWPDIELSAIVTPIFAADRQQRAAEIIQERGWEGITVEQVLAMPTFLIGTEAEIRTKLLHVREEFGFSYLIVSDSVAAEFAPLVRDLTGS